MKTLAVIILTRDEEENITEVVKNAKQCTDEVLVVDSGSKDKTCPLAREAGARVVTRLWDGDFSAQRNFALKQTKADWVLYLDADERLMPECIQHIGRILQMGTADAQYRIKRKTVSFGAIFQYGALYPDYVIRMFPREQVVWVNPVHEHSECPLPTKTMDGYLRHYAYRDLNEWIEKLKLYTSIWAENAYRDGKRVSAAVPLAHALVGTFRVLILKAGFLDGWPGIYMCINHFFYTLMKYLKLRELQRKESEKL